MEGVVEIDETSVAYRTKGDPVAGGAGRSHDGKLLIAGVVDCKDSGKPGRIRLSVIPDFSSRTLKGFVATATGEGAAVFADAFSSYQGMEARKRLPKTVDVMAAHVLLPWIHRVFADFRRLALGVYHGLRRSHLQTYLDEFALRWNRRRHDRYRVAFHMLPGIGLKTAPVSYGMLVGRKH